MGPAPAADHYPLMADFEYIARDAAGQRVAGVLEAATEAAAVRALDEQRLFPVRVKQRAASSSDAAGPRVGVKQLSQFFEQLADLLRAGVPMLRALATLSRTSASPRIAGVVRQVHEQVAAGKSLEEAMGRHPTVFNTLQIAMVRAGERGGFLEQVLADMSAYLERQDDLRSKVRGSLIYPCVLVTVGVLAVTVCLVWLVPKFRPIFEGIDLPLPSRMLFAASEVVSTYWPMTLMGLAMMVIALALFLKTDAGRRTWFAVQMKVPVVGHALRMVSITRFCRVLGTMLASGVPVLQSLQISRDATGLPALADSIDDATESVRHGKGLTPPLRQSNLFPPQLLEMIAVAEESNQLEKTLLKIADTVERRTNRHVDSVVRLVEPVILVILAAVILFVAIGLLYPIFTMARTIR